ncbi:hypothetical protein IFM89_002560 [Coptis chinensis]|uniref:LOB domain-containing protein n=1 Tax=Coptis chinensis TaxID=261450 RepID=A0A835HKR2_9MAGN|nr:hypothetical protein IFM89_002560 [Coptis chinensis]
MIPTRCAACKYLRRRCPSDCIFAPYFPPSDPQRFACVHKIYGASNVGKMLKQLKVEKRSEAVNSLQFEAQERIQNPVYGCLAIITQLQREIQTTEQMLAMTQAQITFHQQADLQGSSQFQDFQVPVHQAQAPSPSPSTVQQRHAVAGTSL